MGKKLIEIKRMVDNSGVDFYNYLELTENAAVFNFIKKVSELTNTFVFSGVIRNFFLGEINNRDIDIILEKPVEFQLLISDAEIKRNSFGGFKILYSQTTIDLWYLENTWAFTNDHFEVFNFGLEQKVPYTAFFNFSSIVYCFNDKRFRYTEHFLNFLKDREIDYVYEKNPNYQLCVINTFYYSDKYQLEIKDKLKHYIVKLYNENEKDYTEVQMKHFGKVIYPNSTIEHRVETIFYQRQKLRGKKTSR